MEEFYQGIYRDQHGEEAIVIRNDGKDLWTTIRGVEFTSQNLYEFEMVHPSEKCQDLPFTFVKFYQEREALSKFRMEFVIPVVVVTEYGDEDARILVRVENGSLRSELRLRDHTVKNPWAEFDWFYEKQASLPKGWYLKSCVTCAYSDYHPIGNDLFGDMMCFRGNKAAYLKVTTKSEFFEVMLTCTERVQETYVCPEFERRVPGTGYRG